MRGRLWLTALILIAALAGGVFWLQGSWEIEGLPWRVYLQQAQIARDQAAFQVLEMGLWLRVTPETRAISGEGVLRIVEEGTDRSDGTNRTDRSVWLMLDPRIVLENLRDQDQAFSFRRWGHFVQVKVPASAGPVDLHFGLKGTLPAPVCDSSALLAFSPEDYWHPVAPNHFMPITLELDLPVQWRPILGGEVKTTDAAEGRATFSWHSPHPLQALGLTLTREEDRKLQYGDVTLHTFASQAERAAELLPKFGRVYGYFTTLLGPCGMPDIHCVFSTAIESPFTVAEGTLLLPSGKVTTEEVAEALAPLWWPGKLDGRIFSESPAAGAWMHVAIPQYLAWRAVEALEGEAALIEMLKRRAEILAPLTKPIRGQERLDRFIAAPAYSDEFFNSQVARLLAKTVGEEAFTQALRNLMRAPYQTVDVQRFLDELELVSERDLEEWARVWMDRVGPVDYGLTEARQEGGRLHVQVKNLGDFPSPVGLKVRIIADYTEDREITTGAASTRVSFDVSGAISSVTLDPEYVLPDLDRSNNLVVLRE